MFCRYLTVVSCLSEAGCFEHREEILGVSYLPHKRHGAKPDMRFLLGLRAEALLPEHIWFVSSHVSRQTGAFYTLV
ncbi:hypothetical protein C0Z16_04405 [Paraburkholderia rhynchosiae]|uniref:Secreted protein n=1 Tax=Paraburkholderia rhynchosiae TaxID=487049 RepID=A0ABX4VBJ9_9BURK|nr:hypothetical protein C0Z16_04405 [Paraburkholderia rhynchosiae]